MGLEAVAGTRNDVKVGARAVELLGTARIVHRHHKVGIALHDEHGSLILADEVKGRMSWISSKKRRPIFTPHSSVTS